MTTEHEHTHGSGGAGRHPETAQEWDERYSESDRIWTTNVNPALVAEVEALEPGTVLDVGSGEGADARWLAAKGWSVTAVDISQVAVERARAADPDSSIGWHRLDVTSDPIPDAPFGLVSAIYFHIARRQERLLDVLLDSVEPGGQFLLVVHAAQGMREHGFDPSDYFFPSDVAARLGDDWTIEVNEVRPRGVAAGNGVHVDDDVLRARRLR
ncbi:class I SAM-dependent methyltransferase [Gordonia sp. (in: high G+C Gram-positive bacteria)]|uniref:class I SAM-dependent methyltransferase n=1 Tax=Gordonia sp. (in: high G+C Gram-positive bacteria) TaxID=84139 RepID=UPI003F9DE0DA